MNKYDLTWDDLSPAEKQTLIHIDRLGTMPEETPECYECVSHMVTNLELIAYIPASQTLRPGKSFTLTPAGRALLPKPATEAAQTTDGTPSAGDANALVTWESLPADNPVWEAYGDGYMAGRNDADRDAAERVITVIGCKRCHVEPAVAAGLCAGCAGALEALEAENVQLAAQLEFEDQLSTEFIGKVWDIVKPDDGDWDYPAQVLRYVKEMRERIATLESAIDALHGHVVTKD